ncbi:SIS domain-containing protein [Macrococcus armenti]|uniref:SIS domain-containing protein n=1 Tax=Macrococcus armenti TaxID=2875764 RepID=A0ABY3ZUH1_9STAP|nr:SIS domain-containing protein [Macrococcus armenti]UOB20552.1 SIS domain-containing protein [Macrococcus armenti]
MNLHDTHTYKEIKQQPLMWQKTVELVDEKKDSFNVFIEGIKAQGKAVKILFTGAGSSAYVGDTLRTLYLSDRFHDFEVESVATTDFVTNPENYLNPDKSIIVVSFARSGNSPETKGTVELADQLSDNVYHVFITNNKDGYLAKYTGEKAFKVILPEETNDKSLAMTSSFSTMLLAAYLLFIGKVSSTFTSNAEEKFADIEAFAKHVSEKEFKKVFYVGSKENGAITRETSLKLNELSAGKIEIARETTLGFRHGPKAGLKDGSLFILLAHDEPYIKQYEVDLVKEVSNSEKNYEVLVLDENHNDIGQLISQFKGIERALIYLTFGQLFATYTSVKNGLNPDNPSPDGFINRVVKGVEIYPYEQGK